MLTPFGIAIRKIRLDRGMRLIEMAQGLNVTSAYLSAVETGKKSPSTDLVTKIAALLDLKANEVTILNEAAERSDARTTLRQLPSEERRLFAGLARSLPQVDEEERERAMKQLEDLLKSLEKNKG